MPAGACSLHQATDVPIRSSDTPLADRIDRNRIVELTQKMIRINSEYKKNVTHNHKEIADFVAREVRALEFETEVITQNPEFPIVVARLRGSEGKPVVGITELYDTVYIGDRSVWTVDPLGARSRTAASTGGERPTPNGRWRPAWRRPGR